MTTPLTRVLGYGLGDCAYSLVMNSVFGFAMLYYTEALGLKPALAGLAMSASVLWELVADPLMGHLSDRTRTRYGRRHPWMLLGGLVMAVCFVGLWTVPAPLHGQPASLFAYLVVVNLLLRTGVTMFFVPYLALGFEVCPDYEGRSSVQAVRQVMNMAANFAGPALAWSIFFRDAIGPDGARVLGTSLPHNFIRMGAVFAGVSFACVLATLWFTRQWCTDTRRPPAGEGTREAPFLAGLRQSLSDACLRRVLLVVFLLCCGTALVSSLQMYVYVYFMRFLPEQKSLAHGSTMVGMALGGMLSAWVAKHLDKKGAVLAGGALSLVCTGALALLFLTGWVPVGKPAAFAGFVVFHGLYWLGNGIAQPTCTAMVADAGGLWQRATGENKDGTYSALFSVSTKIAMAFGLAGSGWALGAIGFDPRAAGGHPPEAVWRLGCAMFLVAPLMGALALAAVTRYPLSRKSMDAPIVRIKI